MSDFNTPAKAQNKLLEKVTGTPGNSPAVKLPTTPFLKKMGFGRGVNVYLYERSPKAGAVRSPWAMKKIMKRHASSALGKKMEDEAKVLKSLSHPNIIGYRAFKKGPDGAHTLVMEDGQKALFDIMEERNDNDLGPFPAKAILTVIRCMAAALDYIHTEKHFMHGDIKSTNILIVGDFESAKLSDFGVTLPVDSELKVSDPSATYMGTEAWSAIEVIQEETITTKADIFSFGLVIYEMMALHGPHMDKLGEEDDEEEKDESMDTDEFREALGTRPPLPEDVDLDDSYRTVLEIFFACTNEDPARRPSAKEILQLLDQEPEDMEDDGELAVNIEEAPSAV